MSTADNPLHPDDPDNVTPAPAAGGPAESEKLEGEDAKDLVGIMYSERRWVVPGWYKAVFFWAAVCLVVPLVGYTAWKRITFEKLLVDSVVEPESLVSKGVPPPAAPPIQLPPGDGGPVVDLAALKGQWVFVNFWATWCAPCRDEMPSMEMLNRRITQDGLPMKMLAVSVDDAWVEVNRFFGDTQPTFEVVWDKDKRTAKSWGTTRFPESYLVNPEGKVVAKFVGPRDWYNQATVQYFQEVIAGRRPPST